MFFNWFCIKTFILTILRYIADIFSSLRRLSLLGKRGSFASSKNLSRHACDSFARVASLLQWTQFGTQTLAILPPHIAGNCDSLAGGDRSAYPGRSDGKDPADQPPHADWVNRERTIRRLVLTGKGGTHVMIGVDDHPC